MAGRGIHRKDGELRRGVGVDSAVEALSYLQWPAMVASITAAWLVASQKKSRRQAGFWWFLGSNVLWVAWGWHDHAWALIALQVALALLNLRGLRKNDSDQKR
jgi:hypothetical protein